jgi:methionyl-tRNA formyltransferase
VSARFSYVFDSKMISSTPLGIINVHPGALPRYAGLFPGFWQMLEGCPELGCSVHFVDSGTD